MRGDSFSRRLWSHLKSCTQFVTRCGPASNARASRPQALSLASHPFRPASPARQPPPSTSSSMSEFVGRSPIRRAVRLERAPRGSRGVPAPESVGVWTTRILRLARSWTLFLRSLLHPTPSPLRVSICFLSHTEAYLPLAVGEPMGFTPGGSARQLTLPHFLPHAQIALDTTNIRYHL